MSGLSDPLMVVAILLFVVALSEWLVAHTVLRHLGTACLVILFGAILANVGLLPTASDQYALYDGIFTYLAPLAIFLLMLEINLRDIWRAGLPMLTLFVIGAAGTLLGVMAGFYVSGGESAFGQWAAPLAGMFAGHLHRRRCEFQCRGPTLWNDGTRKSLRGLPLR